MGVRFLRKTGDNVPGSLGGQRWCALFVENRGHSPRFSTCFKVACHSMPHLIQSILQFFKSWRIAKNFQIKNNSIQKGSGAYGLSHSSLKQNQYKEENMTKRQTAMESVEALNVIDDALFQKMAEDKEFCEEMISTL